jgi:GDP-D-mannose dehydratase
MSGIHHLCVDPHEPEAELFLHYGHLSDITQFTNLIYTVRPEEICRRKASSWNTKLAQHQCAAPAILSDPYRIELT